MNTRHLLLITAVTLLVPFQVTAQTDGDVKQGGKAYRICAGCHSLKPGIHLSGPSLANIWGERNAAVPGFGRYTAALKKAEIVWNENTLNAWLADPQAMVPGTTMTFRGMRDDKARADIIAFLRQATAKGGYDDVIKNGVISEGMAMGQMPPDLSSAGPQQTITSIRHCGDAYYVTTADGTTRPLWETNVRLKIDTSLRGPKPDKPALLGSGMVGDRVSVVFSSLAELTAGLKDQC